MLHLSLRDANRATEQGRPVACPATERGVCALSRRRQPFASGLSGGPSTSADEAPRARCSSAALRRTQRIGARRGGVSRSIPSRRRRRTGTSWPCRTGPATVRTGEPPDAPRCAHTWRSIVALSGFASAREVLRPLRRVDGPVWLRRVDSNHHDRINSPAGYLLPHTSARPCAMKVQRFSPRRKGEHDARREPS